MSFALGPHFVDEVTCDVTMMDCYGLLLGKPFQYDRKAFYDAFHNTYQLQKDNKKYSIHNTSSTQQPKNLVLSCDHSHLVVHHAPKLALHATPFINPISHTTVDIP